MLVVLKNDYKNAYQNIEQEGVVLYDVEKRRARGNSNTKSDIDVFLLLKEPVEPFENAFVESAMDADELCGYETYIAPFTLSLEDYIDRKKIGLSIIKNIEKEGRVLYDTNDCRKKSPLARPEPKSHTGIYLATS